MIILDTNVVSALMRPSPDANVVNWVTGQTALNLYLSTVSEAELRFGVEILPTGARRTKLLDEVDGMLREDFAGRVPPFRQRRSPSLRRDSRRPPRRRASNQPCRLPNSGNSPKPGSVSGDKGHGRLRGERGRRDQPLGGCMNTTKLMAAIQEYLADLRRIRASGGATGERSYYPVLTNLLNAVGSAVKP